MKKILVNIILALSICLTSISYPNTVVYAKEAGETSGTCGKNLKWTLSSDGTLTISGIGDMEDWDLSNGEDYGMRHLRPWEDADIKSVVIKDGVTSIGGQAFSDYRNITSVIIPESVKSIGSCAFNRCEKLAYATIPDSITYIGNYAFNGTLINSVNIPASLKEIGEAAFASWEMENITISESNNNYHIIDGILYNKDISLLMQAPVHASDFIIPDTVYRIGDYAFQSCSKIKEIVIPESVISIGNYTFRECPYLSRVSFPKKLDTIGNGAFKNCYSLESISIPDSVTQIGLAAFNGCLSLEDIYVPDGINGVNMSMVENTAFFNNRSNWERKDEAYGALYLGNYLLGVGAKGDFAIREGTVEISDGAFMRFQDKDVTNIYIPNSVRIIGDNAFEHCIGLTGITIPDSVQVIGDNAFGGCTGLTSITIPDSVQAIGDGAFGGCTNLNEITIPGSAVLGSSLFKNLGAQPILNIKGSSYKEEWYDALNSSGFKEINYERKLLDSNIKDNKDGLVHYAQEKKINMQQAEYSTYSNETSYTNTSSTDKLQEAKDPDGNLFAFYGDKDRVVVFSEVTGKEHLKIENPGFKFGAATIGDDGYYYIFWGKDIPDDIISSSKDEENIQVCKYDSFGHLVKSLGFPVSYSSAQFPFHDGNANISYNKGYLCIVFNVLLSYETRWLFEPTSSHYQCSEWVAINAETMEMAVYGNAGLNGSMGGNIGTNHYVYGISMIPTDYGFAALQRAGTGERGIRISRFYINNDEVRSGGVSRLFYHCSGNEKSEKKDTYTYMGGFARSASTYALAGKSERVYTSSSYMSSKLRTGVYDVFVRIMDQSLAKYNPSFAGITRKDETTGEDADYNVIWLTNCNKEEKAASVKIVTLQDGSYCVLWEKMVNGKFDSIRYVILDELGHTIRRETAIYGARLSSSSIQPVVQKNTLSWAVADKDSKIMTWYSVDLDKPEKYDKSQVSANNIPSSDNNSNNSTPAPSKIPEPGSNIKSGGLYYNILYTKGNTYEAQFTSASNSTRITIPSAVMFSGKMYKVTSIASNAVKGSKKLKELTIGANIKVIGKNAFKDCNNLKKIIIKSEKLTSGQTGSNAFKGINSRAVIKVPKNKASTYKKLVKAKGAGKNVKIVKF